MVRGVPRFIVVDHRINQVDEPTQRTVTLSFSPGSTYCSCKRRLSGAPHSLDVPTSVHQIKGGGKMYCGLGPERQKSDIMSEGRRKTARTKGFHVNTTRRCYTHS